MPQGTDTKPVEDSVARSAGTIAVGEDLEFQRSWWKFERFVWIVFALILVADLSGLLGRGPLSKAEGQTSDGALRLKYEKVERSNTPSIMTVLPAAGALRDGSLHLFVSDSVLNKLGAQRIIPAPASSTLGDGGVTYVFPATALPMTVQFALQPSFIGSHTFRVGLSSGNAIQGKVLVLP